MAAEAGPPAAMASIPDPQPVAASTNTAIEEAAAITHATRAYVAAIEASVSQAPVGTVQGNDRTVHVGVNDGTGLNSGRNTPFAVTWPNGARYVGSMQGNKMHGRGKYTRIKPAYVYVGEFQDDQIHGKGTSSVDDETYVGEFQAGEFHGQGRYTFATGDIYEGGWQDGRRHGLGKYTYADGDVYEGGWHNGTEHGHGKHTSAAGDVYKGEWRHGSKNGQGKEQDHNGIVTYDGMWQAGYAHGNGVYTNPSNGAVHEGLFHRGHMRGYGVRTLRNGTVYKGEYRNGDKKVGVFIVEYADGRVEEHTYRANKKQRPKKIVEDGRHTSVLPKIPGSASPITVPGDTQNCNKVKEYDEENDVFASPAVAPSPTVVTAEMPPASMATYTTYEGVTVAATVQSASGANAPDTAYPSAIDGVTYAGEYQRGEFHQHGKITSDMGDVYEGGWQGGRRHGQGRCTYAGGDVYEGGWKEGAWHGQGKVTRATEDVYEGGWKDGIEHGLGTFTSATGNVYEGSWQDGKQHGLGKHTSATGNVYEGHWRDGRKHGQGKYTLATGNVFEGAWQDDKKHGRGKEHNRDGTLTYDGMYEAGSYHGSGIHTSPSDGAVHRGLFHSGNKHGHGICTLPNGTVYKGAYCHNNKVGMFTIKHANGRIEQRTYTGTAVAAAGSIASGPSVAPGAKRATTGGAAAEGAGAKKAKWMGDSDKADGS